MTLYAALANIHRDPFWWRKVLAAGAWMLTIVGAPWAYGLVAESLDNVRKGYPTPLPFADDWPTRYIIGLLAALVDFVFFVFPIMLVGLVMFCVGAALALNALEPTPLLLALAGLVGYVLIAFGLSLAWVGRLIYVRQGQIEEALSLNTLREALDPRRRGLWLRARLRSLPAYTLPLLLAFAARWAARSLFPGALVLAIGLSWLALSALVYAQLVAAQLYGAAARQR